MARHHGVKRPMPACVATCVHLALCLSPATQRMGPRWHSQRAGCSLGSTTDRGAARAPAEASGGALWEVAARTQCVLRMASSASEGVPCAACSTPQYPLRRRRCLRIAMLRVETRICM